MARRTILAGLIGSTSALLGGCGLLGGNNYRFRMTVEANSSGSVRQGSSVYEASVYEKIGILPEEGSRQISLKGEAVIVDLPGGPIFIVMAGHDIQPTDLVAISMHTLDPEFHGWPDSAASAKRLRQASMLRKEVARDLWPVMVRFDDLDDPRSAVQVDPEAHRIVRVIIETTRDDVTFGIASRLPWLPQQSGALINSLTLTDLKNVPIGASLTKGHFSSELD